MTSRLLPRRWPTLLLGLLSAGLMAAACPKSPESKEKRITVFVTGDLRGYLEPCGCSENMLGGIYRAAAQVQKARSEVDGVVLADAGDSLFGRLDLTPEQVPQAERKAKAIAEAFAAMGMDAAAVGEKDLARGVEFLQVSGLRPVLNAGRGPETAPSFTLKDVAGVKVGLVAAGGDRAAEQLAAAAQQVRSQGAAIVVALVHVPPAEASRLADKVGRTAIDAMVTGHAVSELDGEQNRVVPAGVPVLQVMSKGRALARLDFTLRPRAVAGFVPVPSDDERQDEQQKLKERIQREEENLAGSDLSPEAKAVRQTHLEALKARLAAQEKEKPTPPSDRSFVSYRFVKLGEGMPADDKVKEVVARYTRDTAELNLAWAKANGKDCPPPRRGQAAFVGSGETCQGCHEEAFKVWKKTGHAHAYATLEQKHKQFDLDCVRCHVTGPGAPGGVCRVDKVDGRKDVQCESCHGPASLHQENPSRENIVGRPTEQNCRVCHTPENSAHFDYAKYLPKVLGPGHGGK